MRQPRPVRIVSFLVLLVSSAIFTATSAAAQDYVTLRDNGLVRTPPMGWNSWNKFACNVNEGLIRQTADAMVSSGMRDAGYTYVVIDDCWQVGRDAQGNIIPDPERFPSGMKALADYVHSKGLKFGVYSDAGTHTCQKRPGGRGYEYQDARQYAAWGVDYLKYDWCSHGKQNSVASYSLMADALQRSGRPIVFSICEWGSTKPWLWAPGVGNLWRTTGDIRDSWDSMVKILDQQVGLAPYAGPGHWNDPDMLEVGNGGMSDAEYRAHFSLWAMLAAPLMAGNDLRSMPADIREILTNREVIAVDQDSLGKEGERIRDDGDREVWSKPMADGGRAVVLLNRGTTPSEITVTWPELHYSASMPARVRDLWAHRDVGRRTGSYAATVPGHGVVMIRVTP
ncbi:MAG TPA: glycoside hydrolase family 27 protein [Longimicrobiaceae bacterium]|nr:glycoside hydrolase family 27 protein [Longimicrobiaceae bacterium]